MSDGNRVEETFPRQDDGQLSIVEFEQYAEMKSVKPDYLEFGEFLNE